MLVDDGGKEDSQYYLGAMRLGRSFGLQMIEKVGQPTKETAFLRIGG